MRGLLLQPYDAGSHRAWAAGYVEHSALHWRTMALPGRFWKWRMHGAAVTFARLINADPSPVPDVVLTTDMLDVATLRGLLRWTGQVPIVLYMHENQLAYPAASVEAGWTASRQRRAARADAHYGWINLTSALAADRILWNSAHNRDAFLAALPAFVRQFPDCEPSDVGPEIAAKSEVMPLGLTLPRPLERIQDGASRPPRLLWNHRWEHDKGPDAFVRLLEALVEGGEPFEGLLLGETFGRVHPARARAVELLGERLAQDGFAPDDASYQACLSTADVVVSTARHEFFGASVCEAVWAGAWPVLPIGLAYGEWVPPWAAARVFYADPAGLLDQTRRALEAASNPALRAARQAEQHHLRSALASFAWPALAPRFDARLKDVVSRLLAGPDACAGPNDGTHPNHLTFPDVSNSVVHGELGLAAGARRSGRAL